MTVLFSVPVSSWYSLADSEELREVDWGLKSEEQSFALTR
jgi:hypothetical protein